MGETTPFKRPGIFRSAHLLYLAQISFQAQQYEKVRDLCLEVLKLAPDDPEALFLLGLSYYYMQDHTQAIPYFLKLLDDVPDYPEVHYFLGKCYNFTNNNLKAIEHLNLAFLYDPKNKKAPYSLYEIYRDTKYWVEAKEYLIQVMLLSPNDKKLWMEFGLLLKKQSFIHEAEDILNRTELLGNGPYQKPALNALYSLGEYLFLSNDAQKASFVFQKLLMEEINDLSCLSYLSYIAFYKKNIKRGYDLLVGLEEIAQNSSPTRQFEKKLPIWRGEDLKNKKLYIRKANSIAIELLAAHSYSELIKVAQEIYIEVSPTLFDLFVHSFPKAHILVESNDKQDIDVDYEISSCCLLRLLRSDIALGQYKKPYIKVHEKDKKYWQKNVDAYGLGIKIGVDASFSKMFPPIQADMPQAQDWNNLELYHNQLLITVKGDQKFDSKFMKLEEKPTDIVGFSALVSALDLIVTTNLETAHLAGSMNVPCWYLTNGFEWFFYGEEYHPFYNSVTIFKKDYFKSWDVLMNEVNKKLREEKE
ncbi:MAG: tetratricopeptide repeat protein [Alphaproteobacteria bacterium]|nr:tetratricopeptide repeat protein [Alphaproteobacteria bacterium]